MEYRACQRVTWLLACFSCVFLVFWLKSDGISCMSISYEGFGVLFVGFLGLLVEKRWNIVHVNELRGFWSVFHVFSRSFG